MDPRFNKAKKKVLIYSSIFVFLLLFLATAIPTLRTPFFAVLREPLTLLTLIKRETSAFIFYHRNFIQNEKSKKEIDLLRQKLNALNEVYLENARLKNLLSLKERSPYKVITSYVIGRSPEGWSSAVVINKGSHHGIKRGMAVTTYLGLAGQVIETTQFTSKILLISDPGLGISAIVQRSRQEGLVSGTLGSYLIMRYLTEEADISIGDIIITSGLNPTYPKGLLIGSVVELGKEFSGLSRYAIIKPAVNPSNIEEVLIIVQ